MKQSKYLKEMIMQFLNDADCIIDLAIWKGQNHQGLESHISNWVDDYIQKWPLNAHTLNTTKKRNSDNFGVNKDEISDPVEDKEELNKIIAKPKKRNGKR